jgi:hypothetical protein
MSVLSMTNSRRTETKNRSDLTFGIGVAIVLTLLAILSIASGVAPNADPSIWPAP